MNKEDIEKRILRGYNENPYIVQVNDGIDIVLQKLRNSNYLFVLEGRRVLGILSFVDLINAIGSAGNLADVDINDIISRNFHFATFDTLWDDYAKFDLCSKLPILNE